MRQSSRTRGLVTSAVLCLASVVFSVWVIYDHLRAGVPAERPGRSFTASGESFQITRGTGSLEAGSFRLDPFSAEPHVLTNVTMRIPGLRIGAASATIDPADGSQSLRGATLEGKGLRGRADVLTLGGDRTVFEDVVAQGTLSPFAISRFEAGKIRLPEKALSRRVAGVSVLAGEAAGAGGEASTKDAPLITFGFTRLEPVVTVLFQRAYIRGGFAELSDGTTRVGFRRGTYVRRHHKIYAYDAVITGPNSRLAAAKADVFMDDARLVLRPPVESISTAGSETLEKGISLPVR